MSSDPISVQNTLRDTATFPGNFNPQNAKWERTDGRSAAPKTKLVFDPKTKKLLAVSREQAMDSELALDMANAGWFSQYVHHVCSFIRHF